MKHVSNSSDKRCRTSSSTGFSGTASGKPQCCAHSSCTPGGFQQPRIRLTLNVHSSNPEPADAFEPCHLSYLDLFQGTNGLGLCNSERRNDGARKAPSGSPPCTPATIRGGQACSALSSGVSAFHIHRRPVCFSISSSRPSGRRTFQVDEGLSGFHRLCQAVNDLDSRSFLPRISGTPLRILEALQSAISRKSCERFYMPFLGCASSHIHRHQAYPSTASTNQFFEHASKIACRVVASVVSLMDFNTVLKSSQQYGNVIA